VEALLERILRRGHPVVALGEIGLDYSANNTTDHDLQRHVFRRQLLLGVALGLPLVLHVREAEEEALEITKANVPRHSKTQDNQIILERVE